MLYNCILHKGVIMLETDSRYYGLELYCDTNDIQGLKDLTSIIEILNRNDIKIGGYEAEWGEPKIEKIDSKYNLYLGR